MLRYDTHMNLQKIHSILAGQCDYRSHLLSLETCARAEESLISLNSKLAQIALTFFPGRTAECRRVAVICEPAASRRNLAGTDPACRESFCCPLAFSPEYETIRTLTAINETSVNETIVNETGVLMVV